MTSSYEIVVRHRVLDDKIVLLFVTFIFTLFQPYADTTENIIESITEFLVLLIHIFIGFGIRGGHLDSDFCEIIVIILTAIMIVINCCYILVSTFSRLKVKIE